MTDPDDKPSFLARLAAVVTIGMAIFQIILFVEAIRESRAGVSKMSDAWTTLILFPTVSFCAVGGLYYLINAEREKR